MFNAILFYVLLKLLGNVNMKYTHVLGELDDLKNQFITFDPPRVYGEILPSLCMASLFLHIH